MNRKWKPSKAKARVFAERMANDPEFAKAYNERKQAKAEKRRAESKYEYETAGGHYIPTKAQHDEAFNLLSSGKATFEQEVACNEVINGYCFDTKVHHDYIHIINEYARSKTLN